MKMDHDPLPGDHPETERVSTGELPPDTDVQALISAGYERYRHLGEGAVADYIPALAAASPSAFGVCVAGVRGRVFSAGDAEQEFAIESISKLFVFALVCHTLGHEQARQKLGVNSTGLPFNSVMAIELNADRTMNPLVNAGAMATTSLVPGTTADEKFQSIVAAMSRFAGRRLVMDDDVYESEAATNDRDRGIAHLLDGYGRMYCDPDLATDVYTRQCPVRVSACRRCCGDRCNTWRASPRAGLCRCRPCRVARCWLAGWPGRPCLAVQQLQDLVLAAGVSSGWETPHLGY